MTGSLCNKILDGFCQSVARSHHALSLYKLLHSHNTVHVLFFPPLALKYDRLTLQHYRENVASHSSGFSTSCSYTIHTGSYSSHNTLLCVSLSFPTPKDDNFALKRIIGWILSTISSLSLLLVPALCIHKLLLSS